MPNQQAALDQVFQALADPTRRAVLERLSKGAASVSELAAPLDMALPSVMQHLSVLETSGLIKTRKQGRVRMCEARPAALTIAEKWIAARKTAWERNFDRLAAYLDDSKKKDH